MPKLKTDFFTVAQSGPTVDGREIKAAWLNDAAATYNAGQHLSKIWPEHMRWRAMGEITDVRLSKDEETGVVTLENRIAPHDDLIYYVRSERMTQPSIEIIENFANSGKAYQYGLGATDAPASLGVGKMPVLFSQQDDKGKEALELFSQRIALDAGVPAGNVHIFASPMKWADLEFKKDRTYFDLGGLGKIFSSGQDQPSTPPTEDDIDMTPEELKQVIGEQFTTLKQELKDELREEFTAKPEQPDEPETPAAGEGSEPANATANEPATVSADAFNTLKEQHEDLKKEFETFMNQEEKQPDFPEHTGGDSDDPWKGW